MENVTSSASGPSFQLGDIYYLLFRHKRKIVICTILGLCWAAVTQKIIAPPYSANAKLIIKYVLENRAPGPADATNIVSPDQRGETLISSEVQIIKSLDLAKEVARVVGPDKIANGSTPDDTLMNAAMLISRNLDVNIEPKSTVLAISFTHPDPKVIQPVLQEILIQYKKNSNEVHRANDFQSELLAKEVDTKRAQLAQTEEELRKARNKAGVISLEESKKSNAELITRLKQEIFGAQAQLAEKTAILQEIQGKLPSEQSNDNSGPQIPADTIQAHRDLLSRLEALRRREQELLIQFTPENSRVKDVRSQLAETGTKIAQLETAYPLITRIAAPVTDANRDQLNKSRVQIADEIALIASLEAKIKTLRQQYAQVQAEVAALDQMEASIVELRRQQEFELENFNKISQLLAKSRSAEALTPDHISNILVIESPTPPLRNWKKINKLLMALAVGGLALGLGWAILLEYFFDRTIRRPNDIEQTLRLPLFLSIPSLAKGTHRNALPQSEVKFLKNSDPSDTKQTIIPHEEANILNPYFETLRDRLIAYFESINLRHRPKLIAVTGLGKESGISTTASGLARSLSETGEGNVLLVDMTQKKGEGTAVPFFQGKALADIDQILESKISSNSENKLFVVSEGTSSEQLSRQLPQRFSQLVPKLKASNFDYIIFDMPPVSQISVTARLASSMDMVLMVVESEKTDREMAQRAAALLGKANANVGVVMNKTKTYVPGKLFKDREFFLDS